MDANGREIFSLLRREKMRFCSAKLELKTTISLAHLGDLRVIGVGMKDFGLGEIGQIAVNARDLERGTAFYRDKLGMQHLFTVPKMSFFQAGSVRLMLALPRSRSSIIRRR